MCMCTSSSIGELRTVSVWLKTWKIVLESHATSRTISVHDFTQKMIRRLLDVSQSSQETKICHSALYLVYAMFLRINRQNVFLMEMNYKNPKLTFLWDVRKQIISCTTKRVRSPVTKRTGCLVCYFTIRIVCCVAPRHGDTPNLLLTFVQVSNFRVAYRYHCTCYTLATKYLRLYMKHNLVDLQSWQ